MKSWPLLTDYRRALDQLPIDRPLTPEEAIDLLQLRDRVAAELAQTPDRLTPEVGQPLQRLDRQLRGWGDRLLVALESVPADRQAEVDRLVYARSLTPSSQRWERFDPIANVLSSIFLTGSAGLIVDIAAKFFVPGVDLFGSLAVAGQSAIALVTGRTLVTETGQAWLKRWLIARGIGDRYWQEAGCLGSLALLGFLIAVRQVGFPLLAEQYTRWGEQAYKDNRLATASECYERALLFQSEAIEPRYLAGRLADEVSEPEQAQTHYRLVLKNPPERTASSQDWQLYLQAASNLSRLYLLKKDPEQAAVIAQLALRASAPMPKDPALDDGLYGLYKNLGWARFSRGRYVEAESWLEKAIALEPIVKRADRAAAAHCLMAKTLDGLQDYRSALPHWERCANDAAQLATPEGDAWQGQAGDRLENPNAKPPKSANAAY
ncbi:MAG: hypothetical protein BJG00_006990 [Limnothrix sp. CACIAM 69d]|nr:MAG: hypothetical protein BJG00_006990 [Limnothrix sp. CACIAM 69d]